MGDIVRGLAYLHEQQVIHRDLKPNNILVNKAGEVKIGDFGCSRKLQLAGDARYSTQFACRAYRAPEIILSTKVYNQTVDTWALGCIVAEFYRRGPLFSGDSDIEQVRAVDWLIHWSIDWLFQNPFRSPIDYSIDWSAVFFRFSSQILTISRTLGSPKTEDYRADQVTGLQLAFHQFPRQTIPEFVPRVDAAMALLIENCLVYDIDRRWTSQRCLAFLQEEQKASPPCQPHELLTPRQRPKSTRKSAKRKTTIDPDSSNLDLPDLMEANVSDQSISDVSFLSPAKRLQDRGGRRTFPQGNFSITARKKLCFWF